MIPLCQFLLFSVIPSSAEVRLFYGDPFYEYGDSSFENYEYSYYEYEGMVPLNMTMLDFACIGNETGLGECVFPSVDQGGSCPAVGVVCGGKAHCLLS